MKRTFLIVLDSVGVGEAHDDELYNDFGSNTLFNTIVNTNIELHNLREMGLLNLIDYNTTDNTYGYYMRAEEKSVGKDTLTGHLEMMGVITNKPYKTFINGFPQALIDELESKINRKVLGNKNASGTEIIEELGEEHINTGSIILYTSADSVLQIAANEEVIPLEELYKICEIAREITLRDEYKIGRIIARPFIGKKRGEFKRTSNRHDYALNPPYKTVLDYLYENKYDVISIGKIADIFNNNGITQSVKIKNNLDGIEKIVDFIKHKDFNGLCFANLNDFDSLYGHRRDKIGYANALKEFDIYVPLIINSLRDDDLLIITADHGNDPTYIGTDHTRENVPILVYSKNFKRSMQLDIRRSFSDIGATIAELYDIECPNGESFLKDLI